MTRIFANSVARKIHIILQNQILQLQKGQRLHQNHQEIKMIGIQRQQSHKWEDNSYIRYNEHNNSYSEFRRQRSFIIAIFVAVRPLLSNPITQYSLWFHRGFQEVILGEQACQFPQCTTHWDGSNTITLYKQQILSCRICTICFRRHAKNCVSMSI